MAEDPAKKPSEFGRLVEAKEARKMEAKRNGAQNPWFGFGLFGLIGWSVALPTLIGAFLGAWIDNHYPGKHSWTLMLLLGFLVIGCLNAWHWIGKESKEIRKDRRDKDE